MQNEALWQSKSGGDDGLGSWSNSAISMVSGIKQEGKNGLLKAEWWIEVSEIV